MWPSTNRASARVQYLQQRERISRRIRAKLSLPEDPGAWTDEQRSAYRIEHLKEALNTRRPRQARNVCVTLYSPRIRKPEVLSEDQLRKRLEDEINGVEPVRAKKNARITQKGGLEFWTSSSLGSTKRISSPSHSALAL